METSMIPPPFPKEEGLELNEIKAPQPFELSAGVPQRSETVVLKSESPMVIQALKPVQIKEQTSFVKHFLFPLIVSVVAGSLITYVIMSYIQH